MVKAPQVPKENIAYTDWKCKYDEEALRSRGRAISAEEKRAVMERILKVWEKFPSLRLGQLLGNVHDRSLFNDEDRTLCEDIEEFAKKQGK